MSYRDELTKAMTRLSKNPKSLFVGQSVKYGGQAMFSTFSGVPEDQRIEFPVAEELQMGFCTGLALAGYLPVCIFPRIDFMLLAMNQLVNHLDKWPELTETSPKVIIRTSVGAKKPIYAGPQHTQDHVLALRRLLKTVEIFDLWKAEDVQWGYDKAISCKGSAILVEHMECY